MRHDRINNIVRNKIHTQLRPNETPNTIESITGLLGKFLLIAILFFFMGYFICEYFEIYPFESDLSDKYKTIKDPLTDIQLEGFINKLSDNVNNILPRIIKTFPDAVNESSYPRVGNQSFSLFDKTSQRSKLERQNLDMNVLRSQRYYQSVNNNLDAINRKQQDLEVNQNPQIRINSLIQEIPSTYMISNLRNIKENNKSFILELETNSFNSLENLFQGSDNLELDIEAIKDINISIATSIDLNKDISKLFSICKLYITTFINLELLKNSQSHSAHPFQFMNCIASQDLHFNRSNSIIIVTSNIILYRIPKTHSFNIQFKLECSLIKNNKDNKINCKILELELLGSTIQNNLPITQLGMTPLLSSIDSNNINNMNKDGYNKLNNFIGSPLSIEGDIAGNLEYTQALEGNINLNETSITGTSKNSKLVKEWQKLNDEKQHTIKSSVGNFYKSSYGLGVNKDINKDNIDLIAKTKAEQGYDPQLYGDYKCFGVYPDGEEVALNEIEDPITCQSYHTELEGVGVWDSKCINDLDCPFYNMNTKANGCELNTGKCDMPVGITRIGYKKYGKFNY